MKDLDLCREWIYSSDNHACFIERDRILKRLEKDMEAYEGADKYARILASLLGEVSTPVFAYDRFVGRVEEGAKEEAVESPNLLLYATGHMSYDYKKMLSVGLEGILEEIKKKAVENGDEASADFAKNSEIVIYAIRDFAARYAKAAKEAGKEEAARALSVVPFKPAYDFYSALQAVWIMHMIASCYVGARDYAFGRFDQYMYPYYQAALDAGKTREELTETLAYFLIKANEICGRATHHYELKPIPCTSSKQYINIGGETANVFSEVVLDAAMLSDMAQPQIVVMLDEENESLTQKTFEALAVLHDKMNVYNYKQIKKTLMEDGFPEAIAGDFTYSACCTFDLHYHSYRREYYTPVVQIFLKVLHEKEYKSLAEFLTAFKESLTADIQIAVNEWQSPLDMDEARRVFVLDSILLSDSAADCRYPCDGKGRYNVINIFCPGVATVGDSLMVLDKLVFKEKRYGFQDFAAIVKNNFEGYETLHREILQYVKFGNDSENDKYTALAGNTFTEATEAVSVKEGFYLAKGFYSLLYDQTFGALIDATPDGRLRGEPFSENQSPTYGADKNGITALLKSVAKLPFSKTVGGGLNLTFSREISPEILKGLILAYFRMGGIHVGITVIDRAKLEDAMVHPEKYKSLTVRLYGFSEYFISLPKWQQLAVLNRTEYKA